jgi:hypothetical protein
MEENKCTHKIPIAKSVTIVTFTEHKHPWGTFTEKSEVTINKDGLVGDVTVEIQKQKFNKKK